MRTADCRLLGSGDAEHMTRYCHQLTEARQHCEPASADRAEDLEVTTVQGHNGVGVIALGQDDVGRVGHADVLVAVLVYDRAGLFQLVDVEANYLPRSTRQLIQNCQFSLHPMPGGHQVVQFGKHVGRDEQQIGARAQGLLDCGMVGLGRIEVGQQRTGVDDEVGHALPFPETSQQLIGVPGNRLPAGEQGPVRSGSYIAQVCAYGLANDLGLRHALPGRRELDGGLEIVGQVEGRLLHMRMVPPVAVLSADLAADSDAQPSSATASGRRLVVAPTRRLSDCRIMGAHADYPQHWEADVVLRDGGTAHLRPITPDDAEALQHFHATLSPESIYPRFFGHAAHPFVSSAGAADHCRSRSTGWR